MPAPAPGSCDRGRRASFADSRSLSDAAEKEKMRLSLERGMPPAVSETLTTTSELSSASAMTTVTSPADHRHGSPVSPRSSRTPRAPRSAARRAGSCRGAAAGTGWSRPRRGRRAGTAAAARGSARLRNLSSCTSAMAWTLTSKGDISRSTKPQTEGFGCARSSAAWAS